MGWDEAETQGANMSQQLHLHSNYREGYRTVPNRRDHFFTVPEDVQVFEQLYL